MCRHDRGPPASSAWVDDSGGRDHGDSDRGVAGSSLSGSIEGVRNGLAGWEGSCGCIAGWSPAWNRRIVSRLMEPRGGEKVLRSTAGSAQAGRGRARTPKRARPEWVSRVVFTTDRASALGARRGARGRGGVGLVALLAVAEAQSRRGRRRRSRSRRSSRQRAACLRRRSIIPAFTSARVGLSTPGTRIVVSEPTWTVTVVPSRRVIVIVSAVVAATVPATCGRRTADDLAVSDPVSVLLAGRDDGRADRHVGPRAVGLLEVIRRRAGRRDRLRGAVAERDRDRVASRRP